MNCLVGLPASSETVAPGSPECRHHRHPEAGLRGRGGGPRLRRGEAGEERPQHRAQLRPRGRQRARHRGRHCPHPAGGRQRGRGGVLPQPHGDQHQGLCVRGCEDSESWGNAKNCRVRKSISGRGFVS